MKNGFECYFSKKDSEILFGSRCNAGSAESCDVIVSVGGDGAVLKSSQTALQFDKPLLGINGGRLGYLCAFELAEAECITPQKIQSLHRSERKLACLKGKNGNVSALNDIVLAKENYGSVIWIEVYCNGQKMMSFRGDGVIISTPTGSTSYNFSAGGPVLLPGCGCFAITPICPHLSDAGTLVVPEDFELKVTVAENPSNKAFVYCDGVMQSEVQQCVTVGKADKILTLLVNENCSLVNNAKLHSTSLI